MTPLMTDPHGYTRIEELETLLREVDEERAHIAGDMHYPDEICKYCRKTWPLNSDKETHEPDCLSIRIKRTLGKIE